MFILEATQMAGEDGRICRVCAQICPLRSYSLFLLLHLALSICFLDQNEKSYLSFVFVSWDPRLQNRLIGLLGLFSSCPSPSLPSELLLCHSLRFV